MKLTQFSASASASTYIPRKAHRYLAMTSPIKVRPQAIRQAARVFCNPELPDGWREPVETTNNAAAFRPSIMVA